MARPRISGIRGQFALILALAAVVPLIGYGLVSIVSLRSGTRESVVTGNRGVATRAAEEIRRYVSGHAEILKALASQLQNTGLEQWQQTTILRNYVLQFHEFRELTLFDERPDAWTVAGAALILGAGLYTVAREARLARSRRKAPMQ